MPSPSSSSSSSSSSSPHGVSTRTAERQAVALLGAIERHGNLAKKVVTKVQVIDRWGVLAVELLDQAYLVIMAQAAKTLSRYLDERAEKKASNLQLDELD